MNEQFFDNDSFTPRARELVKNAVTLAGSWGHTYIGTEHILLSAAYELRVQKILYNSMYLGTVMTQITLLKY